MSVPVLAQPGPERPHGPRSRVLRVCPDLSDPLSSDGAASAGGTAREDAAPERRSDAAPGTRAHPVTSIATRAAAGATRLGATLGVLLRVLPRILRRDDRGMSTVEYAIGTLAAAAFAAVLYTVVSGDSIVTALTGLVQRALQVAF
jgi:hypothetical protein